MAAGTISRGMDQVAAAGDPEHLEPLLSRIYPKPWRLSVLRAARVAQRRRPALRGPRLISPATVLPSARSGAAAGVPRLQRPTDQAAVVAAVRPRRAEPQRLILAETVAIRVMREHRATLKAPEGLKVVTGLPIPQATPRTAGRAAVVVARTLAPRLGGPVGLVSEAAQEARDQVGLIPLVAGAVNGGRIRRAVAGRRERPTAATAATARVTPSGAVTAAVGQRAGPVRLTEEMAEPGGIPRRAAERVDLGAPVLARAASAVTAGEPRLELGVGSQVTVATDQSMLY